MVSGPLLDRIDLHVRVPRATWSDLSAPAPGETLRACAAPDREGRALLQDAVDRVGLSARGHDRVLRVARTLADLAGDERVLGDHVAEALHYRGLP